MLFDFANAVNYCSSLTLGGKSWRLPTIKELTSIADPSAAAAPYVQPIFANSNGVYWSSTLDALPTALTIQMAFQSSTGAGASFFRLASGAAGSVRCVSGP